MQHTVHKPLTVTIGARVDPALADEVRQLAEHGDRSLSREVGRALREHVARSRSEPRPPADGAVAESPTAPARLEGEDSHAV